MPDRKCSKCKSLISPSANFCVNCGASLKSERSGKIESEDVLKQLRCEKGCGGVLIGTDEPDIFRCKCCESKYLVRREGASLQIVKEVREIKDNVAGLAYIQKTLAEKENAKIDLDELERDNDDFQSSFFNGLLKFFRSASLPFGVILFLLSFLYLWGGAPQAVSLFRTSIVCFILFVFSFVYLWRRKIQYQKMRRQLLRIINRRI